MGGSAPHGPTCSTLALIPPRVTPCRAARSLADCLRHSWFMGGSAPHGLPCSTLALIPAARHSVPRRPTLGGLSAPTGNHTHADRCSRNVRRSGPDSCHD